MQSGCGLAQPRLLFSEKLSNWRAHTHVTQTLRDTRGELDFICP